MNILAALTLASVVALVVAAATESANDKLSMTLVAANFVLTTALSVAVLVS